MRTYDNGSGFTVTFSAADVEDFASSWPCCGLEEQPGHFAFDDSGDLVDLDGEQPDGGELSAFADDCKEYGQKRIKALRRRHKVTAQPT